MTTNLDKLEAEITTILNAEYALYDTPSEGLADAMAKAFWERMKPFPNTELALRARIAKKHGQVTFKTRLPYFLVLCSAASDLVAEYGRFIDNTKGFVYPEDRSAHEKLEFLRAVEALEELIDDAEYDAEAENAI